jgi:hypothetical protein
LFPADFLLNTDTVNNILFYSTNSNLKLLCTSDKIFVDGGTFYSCPKYFYQLFTVHIFKNEHYVPLSYFLLPEKSTYEEETAFRCILKTYSKHFNPTTIVVDYYIYYYYLFIL